MFMPTPEGLAPAGVTASLPPVVHPGGVIHLLNAGGRLDVSGVGADVWSRARRSVADPGECFACQDIVLRGAARSVALSGRMLACTTSRDAAVLIDLAGGGIEWLFEGAGGVVSIRKDRVLAGPNASGDLSSVAWGSGRIWSRKASSWDASASTVYVADGASLTAVGIDDGEPVCSIDAGHEITVVRYDPVTGEVAAGTSDGLVLGFDADLSWSSVLATGDEEAVTDVRSFTLSGRRHVLAGTPDRVHLFSGAALTWSASIAPGRITGVTVMDAKVYLVVWRVQDGIRGADEGVSALVVLDASTGGILEDTTLCTGVAFGPSLDADAGLLRLISFSGQPLEIDVSSLPLLTPRFMGMKIRGVP